ncbi:MAG: hypothetical protein ACI9MC_003409 [Kiritimatiellia bacterium]|jgi:hypothetical protein
MRLHVTVQLHGELIEDVVVPVRDGMRLGDHDDAVVAFPGVDLIVQQGDERVMVRGRWLCDGDRLEFRRDNVSVLLRPVSEVMLPRVPIWRGDIRLAVALAAVVVLAMSGRTLGQVLEAKSDVSEGMVQRVEALLLPQRVQLPEATPVQLSIDASYEAPAVRYIEQTAVP